MNRRPKQKPATAARFPRVAAQIVAAREKAGFTRPAAARRLRITEGTLATYERSGRLPDATLVRMSRLYECSQNLLLFVCGESDATQSEREPLRLPPPPHWREATLSPNGGRRDV